MSAKQLHEMSGYGEVIAEVWRRAKAQRRERSLRAPDGSQPLNEVTTFGVNYDGALTGDDDDYYDDHDHDYDENREPDGYECMACGMLQEPNYGLTCRRCMGPCDEYYF